MCRDGAVYVTVGDKVDGAWGSAFQSVGTMDSGDGRGGVCGEGCGALLEEVWDWSCENSGWALGAWVLLEGDSCGGFVDQG